MKARPLFIPLKTEYFNAFKSGEKDTEYRVYGPRWNGATCYAGRPVTLSKGYGKYERLTGTIESFSVHTKPWRLKGWRDCYGDDKSLTAACIKVKIG